MTPSVVSRRIGREFLKLNTRLPFFAIDGRNGLNGRDGRWRESEPHDTRSKMKDEISCRRMFCAIAPVFPVFLESSRRQAGGARCRGRELYGGYGERALHDLARNHRAVRSGKDESGWWVVGSDAGEPRISWDSLDGRGRHAMTWDHGRRRAGRDGMTRDARLTANFLRRLGKPGTLCFAQDMRWPEITGKRTLTIRPPRPPGNRGKGESGLISACCPWRREPGLSSPALRK